VTIFSTKYHQKRGVFSPEAKSPTSSKGCVAKINSPFAKHARKGFLSLVVLFC